MHTDPSNNLLKTLLRTYWKRGTLTSLRPLLKGGRNFSHAPGQN